MSDTVEPPIPLPPANPGPEKIPAQIAAVTTMVAGGAIAACSFLPICTLTNDAGSIQTISYSSTPDGPVVIVAGVLIAMLGVGRYLTDQLALRVLSGLLGGGVAWAAYVDYNNINTKIGSYAQGSGFTPSVWPALLFVGIAGLIALGSAFPQDKPVESKRGKIDPTLVAAMVIVVVLVTIISSSHNTPASKAPANNATSVATPVPMPVTQVTVRGMYPADTEISFLRSCEASGSATKCDCDLSKLESNVSLERLLAIESDASAGQPLPPDVQAMFESCKELQQ